MRIPFLKYLLFLLIAVFISCQSKQEAQENKIMQGDIKSAITTVSKARIFFGHQSVGQNIIDGIKQIKHETQDTSLHIIDIHGVAKLPKFYFAHQKVGKNTIPNSKCDAFASIIDQKLSKAGLQIAFLKFCFVDVTRETDIHAVFNYYRQTLDSLKKRHPEIRFVHFTVPLRTENNGWKAKLKSVLGRKNLWALDNVKRCEYNELLRKYYKDDPIFDLAQIESTYPDGKRETFEQNGKTYYALIKDYSSDGGHLNERGKQWVANKLLHFLADVINHTNSK